ncbi:MAG: polysaccharide deacetylase [Lachnospiraceae bacterium]|nr:polysaccharide deacetylase [Lachnospiraceae bacterium]
MAATENKPRKKLSKAQLERRRRRRRRALMIRAISLAVLLILLAGGIWAVTAGIKKSSEKKEAEKAEQEAKIRAEEEALQNRKDALEEAERMAMGYDYDGAIELLQSVEGYEEDADIIAAIASYTATKSTLVSVDVTTVPHIFYHSLINDTDRAFNVEVLGESTVNGMNAWMTTIEEFDAITQQMYDNGYVFVSIKDLVVETVNEDGTVSFSKNTNLKLPEGKKPVVLSLDDLSYYHSYEDAGYPNKLVIDDDGIVRCEYTDAQGNTTIGDYDVVARLESFIQEHPDASYKGARGIIALTGYNGVFGYRTDIAYKTGVDLSADQQKWLDEHPDFNWDQEVAEATKVAEALKAEGWEFASHTWGHLSVTDKSVETLKTDHEKWKATVENIIGETDIIIFAHGADIGSWQGYSDDNEQYAYFKSQGFNYFCNVDGSQKAWIQITSDYVRQGRINLDGYMLYKASQGNTDVTENLFDASTVFDSRRPTPVVAIGKS